MTAQVRLAFEHDSHQRSTGEEVVIDGSRSKDKLEFMQELARQLRFPSYFGNNWDAYDESLAEVLDRTNAEGLSIAVRNGRDLWRNLPYEAGKFLQCTVEAIQRSDRRGELVFYGM